MESTEERIMHYQRGIDRSVEVLDKARLLHCIKALSRLPVTMRHLKSTGIGRTVNSLRKIEDGVGDASKRLVTKWKEMVSNAPDSGDSDEACVPDDPDNYESVNYDQENTSPADNTAAQEDSYTSISRPEALDRPVLSPPMVIDVNVSPEEPAPNLSDEDEESEETSGNQSSKHSISKSKESKKESKSISSYRRSPSKDKKESFKISKNSKDNGQNEQKKKDKDRSKSKSESSSSKDKKSSSSEFKKRKVESSDDESDRKKQKMSVCENESDNDDDEPNNFVIDNNDDNGAEDHESSSNERDSEVRESSKDRHKESSLKHSDKSKSKEKRSSSSSGSNSSKAKSHESPKKDKSSEERKKDDKHKSKSSHSSSSSKDTNGKEKDKHSKDAREKSKSDEKSKVKDKKEHKKSKEHKEHKEKKKSKKTAIDGIDSMSGTSFADALGMCSMPPPPKKKKESSSSKSSKAEQSSSALSPQPSPSKASPTKSKTEYKPPTSPTSDSPEDSLALLSPNVKLEPLSGDLNEEVDLASTLPEPSPFYKPLPQINHVQRRFDEEAMLSQVINAKVQRTKVYSGNKSGWTTVPSLQEICIRVLIENIDALEYTGGVPFDILKPILERATADQLFMLEYHNPYLVEESDQLWKFHCNKYFKNKQREEMESWREMYMRCLTEREAKFKAITANIKQSIDKSTPVRSTKLAYVDHFVKPPRNVLRQQAKYGTAKVTTSASDLKKKLITGAAGPSSSSSSSGASSTSANVERISVPPPPPSRSRATSSHPIKKTKAPLMAKALQAIKGRYKR